MKVLYFEVRVHLTLAETEKFPNLVLSGETYAIDNSNESSPFVNSLHSLRDFIFVQTKFKMSPLDEYIFMVRYVLAAEKSKYIYVVLYFALCFFARVLKKQVNTLYILICLR